MRGMRNTILFIATVLAAGMSGAQTKTPAAPPTLTYEEFRRLGPEDRASYLEDMQRFVLQMERVQDVKFEARAGDLWKIVFGDDAFAAAGASCVYAGYLSTTDSRGYCTAPAARSWSYGGQSRSLCSGAGQTLCNPMMYGFGPGGNGICTTSRSNPTLDCDSKYRKIPNYGGAEISKQLASAGLDKEFNAQAEKLTQHCSTPGVRQQSLCKYLSDRSTYMKRKLEAEQKRKDAEEKRKKDQDAAIKKAADAKAATAGAENPPRPPAPIPAADPKKADPAPAVAAPANPPPAAPSSPPASAPAAPAAPVTAPAAPPKANEPPAGGQAKAAEASKPKAPADGCIRKKEDFEAMKDKLPKQLHGLSSGKTACVIMAPQDTPVGKMDIPGAVEMKLDGDALKVGTFIKMPTLAFRPNISAESWATEICVKSGYLQLKFTDGDVRKVYVRSNGLSFPNPDKPSDPPTQFHYASDCGKVKSQLPAPKQSGPRPSGGRK